MQPVRTVPPRLLAPDEKRTLIFDAAREVIGRCGFDAAKMEDSAARAGVGKGTLYNLFDSKEDLFLSLVLHEFDRVRAIIDAEVDPVQDPWGRVEAAWRTLMLRVFPQLVHEWNLNYQLWGFLARNPTARERLFAKWREMYGEREATVMNAIAEGQANGHFRSDIDPKGLALLILSIFDGLLHRAMFDAEHVEPQATLKAVLDLLHHVLLPRTLAAAPAEAAAGRSRS
jgi:AcrR family transcriptional regulator